MSARPLETQEHTAPLGVSYFISASTLPWLLPGHSAEPSCLAWGSLLPQQGSSPGLGPGPRGVSGNLPQPGSPGASLSGSGPGEMKGERQAPLRGLPWQLCRPGPAGRRGVWQSNRPGLPPSSRLGQTRVQGPHGEGWGSHEGQHPGSVPLQGECGDPAGRSLQKVAHPEEPCPASSPMGAGGGSSWNPLFLSGAKGPLPHLPIPALLLTGAQLGGAPTALQEAELFLLCLLLLPQWVPGEEVPGGRMHVWAGSSPPGTGSRGLLGAGPGLQSHCPVDAVGGVLPLGLPCPHLHSWRHSEPHLEDRMPGTCAFPGSFLSFPPSYDRDGVRSLRAIARLH